MPKSLQYILDHADELAQQMADYEPTDEQLIEGVPLATIARAAMAAGDAQRALVDAVGAARDEGIAWTKIGQILGISGEAARQRYAKPVVR